MLRTNWRHMMNPAEIPASTALPHSSWMRQSATGRHQKERNYEHCTVVAEWWNIATLSTSWDRWWQVANQMTSFFAVFSWNRLACWRRHRCIPRYILQLLKVSEMAHATDLSVIGLKMSVQLMTDHDVLQVCHVQWEQNRPIHLHACQSIPVPKARVFICHITINITWKQTITYGIWNSNSWSTSLSTN